MKDKILTALLVIVVSTAALVFLAAGILAYAAPVLFVTWIVGLTPLALFSYAILSALGGFFLSGLLVVGVGLAVEEL